MKKYLVVALVLALAMSFSQSVWAITATFGPDGESGMHWNKEISFNNFNQVFEWNANLNLNGTSNWLRDTPITDIDDIDFSFTTDVYSTYFTQTYTFSNIGASSLTNLTFYSFLDAELDETWWDDMGAHTEPLVVGHPLLRQYDYYSGTSIYLSGIVISAPGWTYAGQFADGWEIDYSGNVWWDIEDGLSLTNAVSAPWNVYGDDYAAALRWSLGDLAVGQSVSIKTLVSTDGTQIPPVPEPATLLLLGSGLFGLAGFRKKWSKSTKS